MAKKHEPRTIYVWANKETGSLALNRDQEPPWLIWGAGTLRKAKSLCEKDEVVLAFRECPIPGKKK